MLDGTSHTEEKFALGTLVKKEKKAAGLKGKKEGKDIHHVNGNALDNRPSNLRATSRAYNRSKNKQ